MKKYKFDSCEIWVGQSAIENDELSTKLTDPTDLWFHVADAPGAHVVLKGQHTDVNIKIAAALAATHSKAIKKLVSVNYTLGSNVTKPKDAPAGLVHIKNFSKIKIQPNGYTDNIMQNNNIH